MITYKTAYDVIDDTREIIWCTGVIVTFPRGLVCCFVIYDFDVSQAVCKYIQKRLKSLTWVAWIFVPAASALGMSSRNLGQIFYHLAEGWLRPQFRQQCPVRPVLLHETLDFIKTNLLTMPVEVYESAIKPSLPSLPLTEPGSAVNSPAVAGRAQSYLGCQWVSVLTVHLVWPSNILQDVVWSQDQQRWASERRYALSEHDA